MYFSCVFQLATEAQYKQCDATMTDLMGWLGNVEKRLANQETLRETVEELRKQTVSVKVLFIHKTSIIEIRSLYIVTDQ